VHSSSFGNCDPFMEHAKHLTALLVSRRAAIQEVATQPPTT